MSAQKQLSNQPVKGWVKGSGGRFVQVQNPRSGNWMKIDRAKGLIVQTRDKAWPLIEIVGKHDLQGAPAELLEHM